MGSASPGRRTLRWLGLTLAALIVFALFSWKEILAAYYLQRAQTDPSALLDLAAAAPGTMRGRAARVLVQTSRGRKALCWAFGREILLSFQGRLRNDDSSLVILGLEPDDSERIRLWYRGPAGGGIGFSAGDRLVAMQSFLLETGVTDFNEYVLAELPSFRFSVLPGDRAYLITGLRKHRGRIPEKHEYLVVSRRTDRLGGQEPVQPEAIPLLARTIRSGEPGFRELASRKLERVGIDPRDPAPGLRALLGRDSSFAKPVIGALIDLYPPEASTSILREIVLGDERECVVCEAVWGLERIGPPAEGALREALSHPWRSVASLAEHALGRLQAADPGSSTNGPPPGERE